MRAVIVSRGCSRAAATKDMKTADLVQRIRSGAMDAPLVTEPARISRGLRPKINETTAHVRGTDFPGRYPRVRRRQEATAEVIETLSVTCTRPTGG